MKQVTIAALLSTIFTLAVLGLLGRFAPDTIIHCLGGVTHSELRQSLELTIREGAPCYIWQGTDGSDNVRRLGSRDGALSLSSRDAAQNEYWHFTRLDK